MGRQRPFALEESGPSKDPLGKRFDGNLHPLNQIPFAISGNRGPLLKARVDIDISVRCYRNGHERMITNLQADGRTIGNTKASRILTIPRLRPALVSIPGACRYLGDLSRSRLYELMPQLDVVRIGARTFLTIASLDRLINANRQPQQ
jgi:hypothetical protein